jgi:L-alanine-DL-glutamate epimerase-like enolase superfamily enzyme
MRDFSNHAPTRGEGRDVEITGIETCVVAGNFDWNLVRVHTDAGVTGIGESYRGGAVTDIMEYMGAFLEGENPLDVERLFRRMVQETSGHGGTTGKVVTAASGIEIALWDAAGKLLDLPVYQLLGGKYRDEIRLYADCHAGERYAVEHGATEYAGEDAYAPEAYAATARDVADLGFDALKFDLDHPADNDPDPYNGRLRPADVERKRAIVEAVTEAVPTDVEVAFDCHWDYGFDAAKRLARALEPYDLLWLEDVLPPENADAQRELARSTETPLATGENRFRAHEFAALLDGHAVDVLTPDPTTCGGLAESKAVASRAEEQYVSVSPHNVCGPVGTAACVHLCTTIPNFDLLEYHALDVSWWADLVAEDLIEDGRIPVPEAPGLGVTLEEAVVREHLSDPGTMFRSD